MSKRAADAQHVWTQFSASEYSLLENWRRSQTKIPPIAATVRHLVSLGLQVEMAKSSGDKAAKKQKRRPLLGGGVLVR
jgi:hypothetical protein